jgi:hypothetical protein
MKFNRYHYIFNKHIIYFRKNIYLLTFWKWVFCFFINNKLNNLTRLNNRNKINYIFYLRSNKE